MDENEVKPVFEAVSVPLPEAGGVAWLELHGTTADKNGEMRPYKVNLTARSTSPITALLDIMEALQIAQDGYDLTPYIPSVSAGVAPAVVPVSHNDFDSVAVDQAFPVAEPASMPAVDTHTPNVYHAVRMQITPQPDGKSKVEFYLQGRQYPEITMSMMPERCAAMLSTTDGWTPNHFLQSGNFTVKYAVTWKYSDNLNKAGKPYKNIVSIAKEV